MFSKTIFKQTLKQNWKLWAIFSALTAVMISVTIGFFDPRMMQRIMDMIAEIPGMEMINQMMGESTSFVGVLGDMFYDMNAIILPLVFVIMTANSLVASQVDRGSMAYTLSTPIRRVRVIGTQALYMTVAIFAMFTVLALAGLTTAQLAHNALWGERYTPDVRAAAEVLDMSRTDVAADINLIAAHPEAFAAGAAARGIDADVYEIYLQLVVFNNAVAAAAEVLDMTPTAINADLNVVLASDAAVNAMAAILWLDAPTVRFMLQAQIQEADMTDDDAAQAMMDSMMDGLYAAAEVLGTTMDQLANNMGRIKNDAAALAAMAEASGMPEPMVIAMINAQLAQAELEWDLPIDFDVVGFINLNLGVALLMFAIGGISFLFSCIFNLTKHSLALGAGIPIAFLILHIMAMTSPDLEFLRFFTLNTLYDTSAVTGGGNFIWQFVVMGTAGIALYVTGIFVFKKKDLPL